MAATPCTGIPLSERDLVTTYDSAADYILTTDSSQPFGQKTKRILHKDIFAGWTNGDMTIQNNTPGKDVLFKGTNSSLVVQQPFKLNSNFNSLDMTGFLRYVRLPITISSGTITATRSLIILDTESSLASDDLDTVNGGEQGMRLILMINDPSRVVTVKHLTGNIRLENGTDFTINNLYKRVELFYQNNYWNGYGINVL